MHEAEASPEQGLLRGPQAGDAALQFKGGEPTDIRVDMVKARSGALIDTIVKRKREPFARELGGVGRQDRGRTSSAPDGRYEFRVGALRGAAPRANKKTAFGLYGAEFPLRAKHSYGDGFGAGRGHDGQDIFARCGSRIVVARGGIVTFNKFQSAAGNYLVIDTKGDGHDHMYAHLKQRSPLKTGQAREDGPDAGTGSGQTGDATACHLHFEYWKAPWQQGGGRCRA